MQEVSLYGKYSLLQDDAYQKLGQDSVLLADFMSFRRGSHVCDFGAGIGVLSVLAAAKDETIRLSAVELIPGAAALCEENLRRNGFAARSEVLACDLRDLRGRIPPSSIDAVVTNPPYFTRVSGYSSGSETRAAARTDDTCDIGALCRAAADVLKWGGRFFIVWRPERLCDLICAMRRARIEPKDLRAVQKDEKSEPSAILVRGVYGAGAQLRMREPLFIEDGHGRKSAEYRRIYHLEDG